MFIFFQNHKKGAVQVGRYIVWGHTDPHAGVTCPCSLLKIWRGDGGGSEKNDYIGRSILSSFPSIKFGENDFIYDPAGLSVNRKIADIGNR